MALTDDNKKDETVENACSEAEAPVISGSNETEAVAFGTDAEGTENANKESCGQNEACEGDTDGAGSDGVEIGQAEAKPQTSEEKIASLEQKVAELNDQYLRKAADFENFRKRMNKEKQDSIDFANQSLLIDLVSILDDFDRAIKAGEASGKTEGDFNALCEGISMIEKRLLSQLENKWGLKRFDSEGEPFDPMRHEALMMEKSPELTEAIVKEDFAKGYTLKDRVIRAAKVKVIMPE
ncbi:protein GrpE [Spirochaetia bacterium]|nr:protein GrpE [Spirochaetia bacterium]